MNRPSAEQLYPVIVLAMLAGLSFWIERSIRDDEFVAAVATPEDPDFIAEGARVVSFDAQGRQRYDLVAAKMTHYPVPDISLLEQPVLVAEGPDRAVRVSARSGVVRQQGAEVYLSENVVVWRSGIDGGPESTLDAQTLTIWPDDERAASDTPVTLTQGGTVGRGNGLRADNIYGTLELIGDASITMPRSPRN